ncbi:hypothetical protein LguiA_006990 [Lonicera macranthoides]
MDVDTSSYKILSSNLQILRYILRRVDSNLSPAISGRRMLLNKAQNEQVAQHIQWHKHV